MFLPFKVKSSHLHISASAIGWLEGSWEGGGTLWTRCPGSWVREEGRNGLWASLVSVSSKGRVNVMLTWIVNLTSFLAGKPLSVLLRDYLTRLVEGRSTLKVGWAIPWPRAQNGIIRIKQTEKYSQISGF